MKLTRSDCGWLAALAVVVCVASHFDMLDDLPEPGVIEEARSQMVMQAAERACGGDIVITPSGARCANDGAPVRLATTLKAMPPRGSL